MFFLNRAHSGIPLFEEDDPELFHFLQEANEDKNGDEIGSLLYNRCIRHLDPPSMEAQPTKDSDVKE